MQAEVCLEQAVHEELRELRANITTTQSQEMMMMQSWLQDWFGISITSTSASAFGNPEKGHVHLVKQIISSPCPDCQPE